MLFSSRYVCVPVDVNITSRKNLIINKKYRLKK